LRARAFFAAVAGYFGVLCGALVLSACTHREIPVYQEQGYVFGTLVEVSVIDEDEAHARLAVASVMREFQRLHELLHAWKPSELSSLNAAIARGESREEPQEVVDILKDAAKISAQSGGLFNPAIGGLIKLWGFQADEFKPVLPDEKKVEALVAAHPQMSDLAFDGNRVGSRNRAVLLDLGGYAKGYALDRAAELLKQQGISNALINIGGNVMALGSHNDRPWRIGIQHPRQSGPIATMDLLDGEAIGTSGDYQRYFELNGKRYCHLIDPRTGRPVQGVEAVTILTRGAHAGTLSDADSKPLFVSGASGWRAAARKMNLDEALLIDGEGVVHLTAAMQKRLEFTDKSAVPEVE
jgi:thiamine biosynthesis lipoprotein